MLADIQQPYELMIRVMRSAFMAALFIGLADSHLEAQTPRDSAMVLASAVTAALAHLQIASNTVIAIDTSVSDLRGVSAAAASVLNATMTSLSDAITCKEVRCYLVPGSASVVVGVARVNNLPGMNITGTSAVVRLMVAWEYEREPDRMADPAVEVRLSRRGEWVPVAVTTLFH